MGFTCPFASLQCRCYLINNFALRSLLRVHNKKCATVSNTFLRHCLNIQYATPGGQAPQGMKQSCLDADQLFALVDGDADAQSLRGVVARNGYVDCTIVHVWDKERLGDVCRRHRLQPDSPCKA